jgi:hypothetical protein
MSGSYIDSDIMQTDFLVALCNSIKEGVAIIEINSEKIIYCNHYWLQLFDFDSSEDCTPQNPGRVRKNKLAREYLSRIWRKDRTHISFIKNHHEKDPAY